MSFLGKLDQLHDDTCRFLGEGLCYGKNYNICIFFLLLLVFFNIIKDVYIDENFFAHMGLVEGLVSLMLLPLFV